MAAVKTFRTLKTSGSQAASNSTNCTEWDCSVAYGGILTARLTNGPSAPTTPPVVQVFIGEAAGVKRLFYSQQCSTNNFDQTDVCVEIPISAMFVNCTITNGSTNAITTEAYAEELTQP